jgi:hypothetical protein
MPKKRTKKNKLKGGAGKATKRRSGSAGKATKRRSGSAGSAGSATNRRGRGRGSESGSATNRRGSDEQLNDAKIKILQQCKTPEYNFCTVGKLAGYCIPKGKQCNSYTGTKEITGIVTKILELEGEKKNIEGDQFDKPTIKDTTSFILPSPEDLIKKRDTTNLFLVQIDINKLAQIPMVDPQNPDEDTYIYGGVVKKNIEFLGWLLLGLKNVSNLNNTSFLHDFIHNKKYKLNEIPNITLLDNKLVVYDGRHRLGFYKYFNINGLVYIDNISKGYLESDHKKTILKTLTPPKVSTIGKSNSDETILQKIQKIYDSATEWNINKFLKNFKFGKEKQLARKFFTEKSTSP